MALSDRRSPAGGAAVVGVELRPGRDMRSIAENDDVLLIEGDASNADFLRHGIGLCRAQQVYLSLSTDMQTLDAVGIAAAVAKQSPQPASLRAFYNDQKSAGCRPLCSRVACFLLRL